MAASLPFTCELDNDNSVENVKCFRVALNTDGDAYEWLSSYSNATSTSWVVDWEVADPKRIVFHKRWRCQHSSRNKTAGRNATNCPAFVDIKVKKVTKDTKKRDGFLKRTVPLPAVIRVRDDHNHATDCADGLRLLRSTSDTRAAFNSYFNDGHSPAEAIALHQRKLEVEDDGLEKLASGAVNPSANTVYNWYRVWRKEHFGSTADPLTKLAEKAPAYLHNGIDVRITKSEDGTSWAALIVTQIMKRTQGLTSAKEIIFIDSTASCDESQSSVTLVLAATVVGALPLAVLLHSSQSTESYKAAFGLLKQSYPTCFGGAHVVEAKEAAQEDDGRDVTGNHPISAAPSLSSRVQLPQESGLKTGQHSMKALNDLLLDAAAKEPSASLSSSSRLSSYAKGKWPLEAKVLCVALVGGALLSIIILLLPKRGRQTDARCLTKSCVLHRGLIERQLDRSVDPCHDFAAYVCGRWVPRKAFSELSDSALMDMVMMWLSKLPDTLHRSATQLPVGRKAAAMLDSCMKQTGSQVEVLKAFMREHGLLWPEDEEPKQRPLEVLLDLALNWEVYLWFSLKLLPKATNDGQKRRVLFTHSNRMLYWRDLFKQIPKEQFQKVYTNIFKLFASDKRRSPTSKSIKEAYKTLQYAFANLVRSSTWKPPVPAVFTLRKLLGYWPASSAEYIKRVFNTTLGIDQPFTMEDLVLFSDVALWNGLRVTFSNASITALLHHLAWLFLLAYAPVASPSDALLILHGSNALARQERLPFCARQVEDSYTLLVSSAAAVALFTEEERRCIDKHLTGILEMATEKSLAVPWLDNQTQHVAAEKLKNVRRVLWPAEEFLTAEVLEEAYANFTDNAPSFAHYWIETRRSGRARRASGAGMEELRIPNSFAEPYILYEHVLNQLSLSIGALAPPLYYKDGTKAMLHGGLGYYYAKELMEALDVQGLQVDPQGNIVSSWLSEAVKPRYAERVLGCLPTTGASVFPEVPAMEVAYAAFKRDHIENDTQLSEELTEEKTFFISACLFSCAKTDADNIYGGNCNKAMANFAPFAKAFKCPEGSNMNPKKKCSFFS